jgi:hypothetical protein
VWSSAAVVPLAVAVFLAAISRLHEVASEQADGTRDVMENGPEQYSCPMKILYPSFPQWQPILVLKHKIPIMLSESGANMPRGTCPIQREPPPNKHEIQDATFRDTTVRSISDVITCGAKYRPDRVRGSWGPLRFLEVLPQGRKITPVRKGGLDRDLDVDFFLTSAFREPLDVDVNPVERMAAEAPLLQYIQKLPHRRARVPSLGRVLQDFASSTGNPASAGFSGPCSPRFPRERVLNPMTTQV